LPATQLGAFAIQAAVGKAGVGAEEISEVMMGCVLTAGLGQAPARQAALGAGLGRATPCTTIGKVCGSGMRSIMYAVDAIAAGSAGIVVAGGMESMTNAPYLQKKARGGYRIGHSTIHDHMMLDGLEDAYESGRSMGTFGEDCAAHYGFTREDQDRFAIASVERAQNAARLGHDANEIAAVPVTERKTRISIEHDEGPQQARVEKIPSLKPAFRADGTITAASSSSISDGAAALVLMRESECMRRGLKPVARIHGHASHAQEPAWFTTAPIGAISKLLQRVNWDQKSVDLFEINEAFAVVPMAAMRDLGLSHDAVNVLGGACAIGHPIGASGARIVVTLLNALGIHGLRRGVASLCIGGGEATALAIERIG
jgi:acetyl-CoA C-acetyltransferase